MKFVDLVDLYKRYENGENISKYLKENHSDILNQDEIIHLSYDLQSGSYIEQYPKKEGTIKHIATVFGDIINSQFSLSRSVLDCGCGEFSTTLDIFSKLSYIDNYQVFDISLSRLLAGYKFCKDNSHLHSCSSINAFVSRLDQIPYGNNSIDILITSHVIEPNLGMEKKIISEMLRVARHGVILHEPDFENASIEQKKRMDNFGYARDIRKYIKELGYDFDVVNIDQHYNPKNKASFTVIKKPDNNLDNRIEYVDPISKSRLIKKNGFLLSELRGVMFPVYDGIPILVESNAILASWLIK